MSTAVSSLSPVRPMKLELVQVLRGIAASMVVIFHAQGMAINYVGSESFSGRIMGNLGGHGVDLFFVISGFIIRYAQPAAGYSAGSFARRRLQRVVPIYWLLTAVMLLAWLALPGLYRGAIPELSHIIRSFLFTTFLEGKSPVIYVGWSLEYELLFYLAVFLLLLAKMKAGCEGRLWMVICAGFSALAMVGGLLSLTNIDVSSYPAVRFFTSSLLLEFALGVLVAEFFLKRRIAWLPAAFVFLALVLVAIARPTDRAVLYGASSAIVLAIALHAENARDGKAPALLVRLGDASYSIYLVQVFALSASAKLLLRLIPAVSADAFVLAVSGVSITAGFAFFIMVESPLTRYLILRSRRREIQLPVTKLS